MTAMKKTSGTDKLLPVVLGGKPVLSEPISSAGFIGEEERKAVAAVLESGELSGFIGSGCEEFFGGQKVRTLEDHWQKKFCCTHAVSINSATTGLYTALLAVGVGPNDEVILPPYTMSGSVAAILFTGATPVFCDIDADNYCLSPKDLSSKITPRTKCLMTVNLFGGSPNYDQIKIICQERGVKIIEDNAQAIGTKWNGEFTGTIGDIGVFSLNRHKNIQSGEGGVITTNDEMLANKCRLIRNHGENASDWLGIPETEQFNTLGLNFRMTEMEAAVAICQLDKLEFINTERARVGVGLSKVFRSFDCFQPPKIHEKLTHTFHYFPVLFDEKSAGMTRHSFCKALSAEGFSTREGYTKPLYKLNILRHLSGISSRASLFNVGSCEPLKTVEEIESKLFLCNFMSPRMTNDQIDELGSALHRILEHSDIISKSC